MSGPELQRVLELGPAAVRAEVTQLVQEGLVEWDPLLTNIWVRITDKGLAAVEDAESGPGPG